MVGYGERVISFSSTPSRRDGFVNADAGDKHYLIPLKRVRFNGDAPLSHGGLTPEELLVPFIVLRKNCSNVPAGPLLQVSMKKQRALVLKDRWQLEIVLNSSCRAQNIKLEAQPPFRCSSGPHGPLEKGDNIGLTLSLESDIDQEGLIQVGVNVTFDRPELNAKEQLYLKLPIDFPGRFLEKDYRVDAFENIF